MLQVSCVSPDLVPAVNIKHRDKRPHADVADYNARCLFAGNRHWLMHPIMLRCQWWRGVCVCVFASVFSWQSWLWQNLFFFHFIHAWQFFMCCVVKYASRCFPPFTRIPVESTNQSCVMWQVEMTQAGIRHFLWHRWMDLRELIYWVQLLITLSPFSTQFSIFYYSNYLEVSVRWYEFQTFVEKPK